MAGRGVLSKGGLFTVWKVLLLIVAFALTVGANESQHGLLPVSGGFKDDIRGAVIMFARNSQLPSVLHTMTQFQKAHNDDDLSKKRVSRDWVFYSDEEMSDEFKLLTTNLTRPGTAFYELWDRHDMVYSGWSLPALSQHGRLRDYNWAWSVAPGTEFHSSIGFDVFEVMKKEGMVYSSSSSGLLQAVRPSSANVEDSDSTKELPHGTREIRWNIRERSKASDGSMTVLNQGDGTQLSSISLANSTASWMDLVYDVCNSCWDFEMGWLDLFRNIDYSKIAGYITNSLDADPAADALSTWPTPLASFGSRKYQSESDPSSCALVGYPDKSAHNAGPRSGVFYLLGNPDDEISAVHERWMQTANDFEEQKLMPGLRSGRTSLFWRATVYNHRGKRARAWLWKAGIDLSVNKPSGHKYFNKEVFLFGEDDNSDAVDLFNKDELLSEDLLDGDDLLDEADDFLDEDDKRDSRLSSIHADAPEGVPAAAALSSGGGA